MSKMQKFKMESGEEKMKEGIKYRKLKREITNKKGWEEVKKGALAPIYIGYSFFIITTFLGILLKDLRIINDGFIMNIIVGLIALLILVIGYYVCSERKYEKWEVRKIKKTQKKKCKE